MCVEPENIAGIEQALEKFMIGNVDPMRAQVDNYRWSRLALQYCKVIETVAGASAGEPLAEPTGTAHQALDR
jgi:hypothetical protein